MKRGEKPKGVESLRFSLQLSPVDIVENPHLAELAEEESFSHIWISDFPWSGDVYVGCALAALKTSRIKIGPGVTNPFTRLPFVTLDALSTLHRLLKDRLVVGIGAGSSRVFSRFNLKREKALPRVRDLLFKIREKLDVPIYLGVSGHGLLQLAAKYANGAILAEEVKEKMLFLNKKLREHHRTDFDFGLYKKIVLANDNVTMEKLENTLKDVYHVDKVSEELFNRWYVLEENLEKKIQEWRTYGLKHIDFSLIQADEKSILRLSRLLSAFKGR